MDMMLEDESGRLRIASTSLTKGSVTGCVLAALGTEQADGTFQIIETVFADLPRQPKRWEHGDAQLASSKKTKPKRSKAGKLAIISGLEITGTKDDDLALDMLMEHLTGETGGPPSQTEASKITRLIIAGNSLANSSPIISREDYAAKKANKKQHYGYDASAYNSSPTECFDSFLSEILPSLPITLIPGPSDPANVALPQQPLHPALFPKSRQYAKPPVESNETLDGLDSVTNPWEGEIDGWRLLGTGGQTIDDLLKYVDDLEVVDAMELMLRWRCVAPTAPDTLCKWKEHSFAHATTRKNKFLTGSRVLPLPRRRRTPRKGLSAHIHRRKPAIVQAKDHLWSGEPRSPALIDSQIQYIQITRVGGYGDVGGGNCEIWGFFQI